MNTFTAQELADFYQQVADGGEMELEGGYGIGRVTNLNGPNMYSLTNKWRIKPKKKVVDLSVLVDENGNGLDCEFSNNGSTWGAGKLVNIDTPTPIEREDPPKEYLYLKDYIGLHNRPYRYCRPRMNHVHAWQGGDCPLPEGVAYRAHLRDDEMFTEISGASYMRWSHINRAGDIIAFEVLGLAEGWQWPWEE